MTNKERFWQALEKNAAEYVRDYDEQTRNEQRNRENDIKNAYKNGVLHAVDNAVDIIIEALKMYDESAEDIDDYFDLPSEAITSVLKAVGRTLNAGEVVDFVEHGVDPEIFAKDEDESEGED